MFRPASKRIFSSAIKSLTATPKSNLSNPNPSIISSSLALAPAIHNSRGLSSPAAASKSSVSTDSARKPPPSKLDRLKLGKLYTLRTPSTQLADDVNKYYNIATEMLQTLPEWLNREVQSELTLTGNYLLVRSQMLEIAKQFAAIQAKTHKNSRIIGIRGVHGMGKSCLIHYLAQFARESNWLMIYLNGEEFFSDTTSRVRLICDQPNHIPTRVPILPIFETVTFTKGYFTRLAAQEADSLKKIAIKAEKTLKATGLSSGAKLFDLVNLIAASDEKCSEFTDLFVDEIYTVTEVPTLVMVDNVNSLLKNSEYYNPYDNYSFIPARQFAFIRSFCRFQQKPIEFGASLFAVGPHFSVNAEAEKFWDKRKTHAVTMDAYTNTELKHALVHYHVSGAVIREPDQKLVNKVKGVTGGVPTQVVKFAGIL